ncbi:MAG: PLP-dependent transferase [Propionibacteriaceae bacterium]|jgi:cystathionine gamma-synthase|nr:PLP-dependent transferase [Propionibacteriaceae bacterium]
MFEFTTRAVQMGQSADPVTGAIVPPITLASTFLLDGVDTPRAGYDYSRSGNPTRDAYQVALSDLESGGEAVAYPSGMSAEDAVIRVLTRPGDTVLYGHDGYGGTGRLFTWVLPAEGKQARRIDTTQADTIRAGLAETGARVLWLETPSNPLLEVSDIAVAAELAHEAGAYLVVDNTFATPVFQRPLELGADVVVHSTTKFVGGHSDLIGGAAIFADGLELPQPGLSGSSSVADEARWWQNATGAVPGSFDCWLAARGLRTLPVRVKQMAASAQTIAESLVEIPEIVQVHYPGLPTHPGHAVAAKQMTGFGAVISVELATPAIARAFAESTKLFRLAVSLGAAESLIEYPFAMTHQALAATSDAAPDKLVRLAIGLEDPVDLIEDLRQAIALAVR